jgi:prolyl 4-hydroxylase
MAEEFTDEWRVWIRHNLQRGCSKDDLCRILLDHGFGYDLVESELGDQLPFGTHSSVERRVSDSEGGSIQSAVRLCGEDVELYLVEGFLEETECTRLIERVKEGLRRSTITNDDEPDPDFRTSSTCDLGNLQDPLIQDVDKRICRFLGISRACSEPMQGQYYSVGQQFKPHTDYFEPGELPRFGGPQGQRTWTFMIYLNESEGGGETQFVKLGCSVQPRRGRAITWNNLTRDGRPNPAMLHAGTPVTAGFKTIITKWFRTRCG